MTDDELVAVLWNLIGGGLDTTTSLTSLSLLHLDADRDLRQRLVDHPELLAPATEEFLRFFSVNETLTRTVTRDVELGGQQLRRGDHLLLSWLSANRDDARLRPTRRCRRSTVSPTRTSRSASVSTAASACTWHARCSRCSCARCWRDSPTTQVDRSATQLYAGNPDSQRRRAHAGHVQPGPGDRPCRATVLTWLPTRRLGVALDPVRPAGALPGRRLVDRRDLRRLHRFARSGRTRPPGAHLVRRPALHHHCSGAAPQRGPAGRGLRSPAGSGPGDVIAYQMPNWAETLAVLWAGFRIGATMVPIIHFYGPQELRFIVRQSGARALVIPPRFGADRPRRQPRRRARTTSTAWRRSSWPEPPTRSDRCQVAWLSTS